MFSVGLVVGRLLEINFLVRILLLLKAGLAYTTTRLDVDPFGREQDSVHK